MRVVPVINYKGGVGKTTLTANIGAALAYAGHRVLLIDLDPQTSLTFSFYRPEEWEQELADSRTIKLWYDTSDAKAPVKLTELVSTPPRINEVVGPQGGRLDLISSHLELINKDLELAAELAGGTWAKSQENYLKIQRRLAEGLEAEEFADYDVALIDCAPNFNITTQTAIIASTHLLIPARPDYLSTLGISFLVNRTRKLIAEYNSCVNGDFGQPINARARPEPAHRVVFTMVQQYKGEPIVALRPYMEQIRGVGIPTFDQALRTNNSLFAGAGAEGVPAVLSETGNVEVIGELDRIAAEFRRWIES